MVKQKKRKKFALQQDIQIPTIQQLFHGWSPDSKIVCALCVGGMRYLLSPVNHYYTSELWACVRSCMWKMVDSTFLRVCNVAPIQHEQQFERMPWLHISQKKHRWSCDSGELVGENWQMTKIESKLYFKNPTQKFYH